MPWNVVAGCYKTTADWYRNKNVSTDYLHHECMPNVDKLTLLRGIDCKCVGMSQGLRGLCKQVWCLYFLLPPASRHLFNLHNLKSFFKGPGFHLLQVSSCCCLVAQLCLTPLWPHGLQPSRFLCPWDFSGKKIGVGAQFLLHGIFTTQGLNPGLCIGRQILYHWATREALSQQALFTYMFDFLL